MTAVQKSGLNGYSADEDSDIFTPLLAVGKLDGKEIEIMVDSGASVSIHYTNGCTFGNLGERSGSSLEGGTCSRCEWHNFGSYRIC